MSRHSSQQMLLGVIVTWSFMAAPVHAVKVFKVSTSGGGHQIWFEAEAYDERNPDTDQYFRVVDKAGAFGQTVSRYGLNGGMMRWTFDISKAGGTAGTWYFWGRVINPNNASDYILVAGDPGDPVIPSGPPFPGGAAVSPFTDADDRVFEENTPSWAWARAGHPEGHTKELHDGENSMYWYHRQGDDTVFLDVFVWTDDPGYVPTDTDYRNATVIRPRKASSPSPENEATDVLRDVVLSWTPDPGADTHDVYFGTSLDDVTSAARADPRGVLVSVAQSGATYDPPGLLPYGRTYYWRIDEVNAPPSSTVFKGDVWGFSVEPATYPVQNITATASSEAAGTGAINTINGSGLTGDLHGSDTKSMWLSGSSPQPTWIRYDFDRAYKLDEMWVWNHNTPFESFLGFGVKDAVVEYSSDGTTWTKRGDFVFARAAGSNTYAHDTTIPFGGLTVKSVRITVGSTWGGGTTAGLSEVRFLYVPVSARFPHPTSGSTGVDPAVILTWRAGREAASHTVYVGADADSVKTATTPTATTMTPSFAPVGLQLSTTYYWRVDEVNAVRTPGTWPGDVWSFSTSDFSVIDDFESYNDTEGSTVYNAWIDGYGTTTNGAVVGNLQAPFAEQVIIHGGTQSMPLSYDNTGSRTVSEAARTFPDPQDWTAVGAKALVIFFQGRADNATGQLYLMINGTKVTYPGDAAALAAATWTQWSVDLASVGGLNPKAVKTLTIGVSGSGRGTLYVDDIRLYRTAPTP